ncbi:MAG: GNAT family N-acetyltransferase [Flavobacteriaceae bacterium]|nr:GNAT family N-acetyltransferase [Flavobacteriaceae bacterium]|tara:strand:- start:11204 stop:11680 length:477 start_codon:yes stop_codon:yes gene_type:complete
MIIRKIKSKDNTKISSIIRQVIIEMKAPKIGTAYADPYLNFLSEDFLRPRTIYYVLEHNKVILGGAGINFLNQFNSDVCELQKMYFLNEARGRGWGEIMINKCLNFATINNFKSCYIETFSTMKKAQKLYLKKGFNYINGPLGLTGHNNCDVWMIKHL